MIVDAATIEVESFGKGRGLPVLLLHEGLGSVSMWRDFPARLADASGRRIIAWSLLGYGNSAPFEVPYAPAFMHREADAAAHLMAQMDIERAHVFGHSDGASIALLLAARHLQLVASLILEAPHVFVEPVCIAAIAGLEGGSADLVSRLGRYHRDADAVFRQWFAIWTDPSFPAWNIEAEIGAVDCPALLIQGDNDEFGTYEQLDRISAILPQGRQVRLPGCGHSPHRDQESAVLAATVAFLKDLL